jgi:16S rRNA (cytidine1402-2'-O)-methyltransferase
VSDAGTPVISDPGTDLVAAAHAAGIRVEPIPGPSAALAALSASGLPADQFLFLGFPPIKGHARKTWVSALAGLAHTSIIYEAPHRIRQTLSDLLAALGDREIALGRELTKAHEELVVRHISEHLRLQAEPRGEYTIVIPARTAVDIGQSTYSEATLRQEFEGLTDSGATPRDAVRTLAKKYAKSSREVYSVVHQTSVDSG